jgi:hypothetical protein
MASETQQSTKRTSLIIMSMLKLLLVCWICFSIGRVLTGNARWGPRVGGILPNGTEVYFQASPTGFETEDRLTVVAPGAAPKHCWVDRVHGSFEHMVLKYNDTGNQLWVESAGTVGSSIDLTSSNFRAELDPQHKWAKYGNMHNARIGKHQQYHLATPPVVAKDA